MTAADARQAYVFTSTAADQRGRLRGIEETADPGTCRLLDELGVGPGWRCVEAGAGGGSIARWLADRVGPTGEVLALDVDPEVVDTGGRANLAVCGHDVVADPLPADGFDLVHARLLLAHLERWDVALARFVAALRPGGVLLVEDYDWVGWVPDPGNVPAANALHVRVEAAVRAAATAAGYDMDAGRSLARRLADVGLEGVRGEGRTHADHGGTPHMRSHQRSREQLRGATLALGTVTPTDYDRATALFDDPDFRVLCPTMIAAWGVRPARH